MKISSKLTAAALLLTSGALLFANGSKEDANAMTTINLWYGATASEAGPPPADWNAIQIIKEKLNIDLKLTALPSNESDQNVKINSAGAGNDLPDLFMAGREILPNLVEQGLVACTDDMFKKMPNRTKLMYDENAKAMTTFDGKTYGLAQPGSIAKNEGVLIRKDWLDKLGLKVPVTTDDYLKVMKAFTFDDPDGNGKKDTWGFGAWLELRNDEDGLGRRFNPLFGAFGVAGTWDLSAKSAGLQLHKPAYFDALSFVKQIVDEKVIDPNWTAYKKDDFRAAWKQGKFGIMREQNAAYALESGYTPFDNNFPDGEWIVIDPPKGPKGLLSVGNYTQGYRIYAISAKAEKEGKKDAIAKLLEWMSSDEGYMLLGYGVKDVNYTIDANGNPTTEGLADPSKAYTKPEMMNIIQLRNMVFYNGDKELATRYPTYKAPKSGKTMSALVVLRDMQSRPWTACIGGDTLPKASADIKRFYEQGVVEFVTGKNALTKENWAKWIAEFDNMGGKAWEQEGIEFAKKNNLIH